jgi:hypothetical protein
MNIELDDISQEAWDEWRKSKATRILVAGILNTREELKEAVVENHHSTDAARLIDMGRCQAFKDVVEFIIEKRKKPNVESDSASDYN